MPGRRDGNHSAIVAALRAAGAFVEPRLADVRHGCPDLLVLYRGTVHLLELKDDAQPARFRKLSEDEADWHGRAACAGYLVPIVENARQALHAIGATTNATNHERT